jgi:ArsR family transcriptional regulator
MILDLMKHKFDKAKELFGDRWLGFDEGELYQWLESAGFREIEVSAVAREEEDQYFETLLASAIRPA